MIVIDEALALLKSLADLGASPAVQELMKEWLSRKIGIPQAQLDAAIAAARDAPPPL